MKMAPRMILAALLLLPLASLHAAEFHVAPNGNDANPGTKDKPFATLERAKEAIRKSPKDQTRTVILGGGIYRIGDSLLLGPEDSGTEQLPVVWQAAPGVEVRLIGGVRLTGWQPVREAIRDRLPAEAREKVVECDLKNAGVANFGTVEPVGVSHADLFFNGRYMNLARYPNAGWLRIAGVPADAQYKVKMTEPEAPATARRHHGPFQYDGDRPERWKSATEVWVHGYWTYDWSDQYQQVERFDLEKKLLWPKPPYHHYGYTAGQRYYYLNLLEELDEPGEWYLDRASGVLYFWPPSPVDKAEVAFPDLQQPMFVLDNVQHVALRGIVMECSRAGAVVVKGGSGVEVAGCTIRNVGSTAIDVQSGTHHIVRSCDIYDVAAAGISLQGGDRTTLTPGAHSVENCHIHHFARVQKTYQPAVNLGGVGHRVAYCYIHDTPHQGIAYVGNDHVIEYCEFSRIAQETGDVGVIYTGTDWTYMGLVFRYNYFHDIHGPGNLGCFTVYPDLPCGGIHLLGNVFYDVDQGFLTNSGRAMDIDNNIFLRCPRAFRFNVWGDMQMFKPGASWQMPERLGWVKYDQPPYSTRYPALVRLAEDFAKGDAQVYERALPKDNLIRRNVSEGRHFLYLGYGAGLQHVRVENNLIGNATLLTGSPTGDGNAIKTHAHDNAAIRAVFEKSGNIIRQGESLVVDADGEDFRLVPDSPARKLGFEEIPFDKIGLRTDAHRPALPLRGPLIAPAGRLFVGELAVRLIPCRRGADSIVRYTLDGSDPTPNSLEYAGPIRITKTTTLKAVALGRGRSVGEQSEVVSATFTAGELGEGHGVYLSDLEESEFVGNDGLHTIDLYKDRGYGDKPIHMAGRDYKKGLVTTPVIVPEGVLARATYVLDGPLAAAQRFKAQVGIDASDSSGQGSCVFLVEVRQGGQWKRLFESGVVKSKEPPRNVDLEISGADRLRLVVTDGGDGATGDHAAWADAILQ
jgi:hypothetical protein